MVFDRKHECRFETATPRYGRTFSSRAHSARREHKPVKATGILVKLGVCAAVCALVLVLKVSQDGVAVSASASANSEAEFDESLGRLKFVEMPGILEVFATDGKYAAGFDYISSEALLDDTLLSFLMADSQIIPAPTACTVKDIVQDAELGVTVCLITARDEELLYHGFSSVSVEAGQQLAVGDDLGTLPAGELLSIKANVAGRPAPPADLITFKQDKAL